MPIEFNPLIVVVPNSDKIEREVLCSLRGKFVGNGSPRRLTAINMRPIARSNNVSFEQFLVVLNQMVEVGKLERDDMFYSLKNEA